MAFKSHHGLFESTRMPFGLKKALGTFQWAMNVILSAVKWQFALMYLEDVVVVSRNPDEHIDHVWQVLTLFQHAAVTLKLKCESFTKCTNYIGNVIGPGCLQGSSHTTDAISNLKLPKDVTVLRAFLNLCNLFMRFVLNIARMAAFIYNLLRKTRPTSFETLDEID